MTISNPPIFQCDQPGCHCELSSALELGKHKRFHHGIVGTSKKTPVVDPNTPGSVQCNECTRWFVNTASLRVHKQRKHPRNSPASVPESKPERRPKPSVIDPSPKPSDINFCPCCGTNIQQFRVALTLSGLDPLLVAKIAQTMKDL
jgi:hypothetical protein